MPNARTVKVFARFSCGLGIAACLSLVLASVAGAMSGYFAPFTSIASITAILMGLTGLAILQSARRLGISELLNADQ